MSILIDRTSMSVASSDSPIGFASSGDHSWPVWDRYLTLSGQRAFHLGNICPTCAFLFERLPGDHKVDVDRLTTRLGDGLLRLDNDIVKATALLMPRSSYRVALFRLEPRYVVPGTADDYFTNEQAWNQGVLDRDPSPEFHDPHTPYYRAGRRQIDCIFDVDYAGTMFEFLVPMSPETTLNSQRVEYYHRAISCGAVPTALAVSTLDVKGPAEGGTTHWCLTHFLVDGHHKCAAAARCGGSITLVAFISIDASKADGDLIDAALDTLGTSENST